jgi:hypothetical protein
MKLKMQPSCRSAIGKFFMTFFMTLSVLVFLCQGSFAENRAELSPGWDIFSEPLSSGQVLWQTVEDQKTNYNLIVTFQVKGAKRNHNFTVGLHLFNPDNPAQPLVNKSFGGYNPGPGGIISREGKTAYVEGWDFGQLQTNNTGDGASFFYLHVPPGKYFAQFTVRIGGANTCVAHKGIYSGCSAVYRTGNRFADRYEVITIGR